MKGKDVGPLHEFLLNQATLCLIPATITDLPAVRMRSSHLAPTRGRWSE